MGMITFEKIITKIISSTYLFVLVLQYNIRYKINIALDCDQLIIKINEESAVYSNRRHS